MYQYSKYFKMSTTHRMQFQTLNRTVLDLFANCSMELLVYSTIVIKSIRVTSTLKYY